MLTGRNARAREVSIHAYTFMVYTFTSGFMFRFWQTCQSCSTGNAKLSGESEENGSEAKHARRSVQTGARNVTAYRPTSRCVSISVVN